MLKLTNFEKENKCKYIFFPFLTHLCAVSDFFHGDFSTSLHREHPPLFYSHIIFHGTHPPLV